MNFLVHPDASLAGGWECLFSTQMPVLLEAGSSVCSLIFLKVTQHKQRLAIWQQNVSIYRYAGSQHSHQMHTLAESQMVSDGP